MKHRFINDGRSPIPMGATAEYACVCGKRGTRESIELHLSEAEMAIPEAPEDLDDLDFGGGDTKAHYLPAEPRRPAPTGEIPPPRPRPLTPEPLPPPPPPPTITSPEVGETGTIMTRSVPRSIAESFQDMLRTAYHAGAASAVTGETFETWYQREVLQ
ncbi:MAG TPA: hypothetical protein VLE97_08675 [Gaiellaceae bacterium]|nr:hypothetical protein [Gaiellaceae bacterium]